MGGVSNKTTSHITRVLDLTYFSKVTEVKVKQKLRSWRILLRFDLECSNLVWICIWAPSTFSPNFGPIGFQILPWGLVAILENQLSPITLELMTGSPANHGWTGCDKMTYFFKETKTDIVNSLFIADSYRICQKFRDFKAFHFQVTF
jgi:hypothetical protein